MMAALAVAAGGAAGSLLRWWATLAAARIGWVEFPWSTIAVNVAGSFAIGWLAAVMLPGGTSPASHEVRLLAMTGLCGGFTTFSAFSLQTLDLLRAGDWTAAAANVLLSVVLCLGAVALGHWAGTGSS